MNSFRPVLGFDFPGGSDGKSICLQCRRSRFDPWVRKMPWRRKWQPIPITLAWKIPWMEEPGRLHSMGSQRVGQDCDFTFTLIIFVVVVTKGTLIFNLFTYFYFWLCWAFVAVRVLSSCGKWGLLPSCSAQTSHCSGFFCGAWALGHVGFSSFRSQALEDRLNSCGTQT